MSKTWGTKLSPLVQTLQVCISYCSKKLHSSHCIDGKMLLTLLEGEGRITSIT